MPNGVPPIGANVFFSTHACPLSQTMERVSTNAHKPIDAPIFLNFPTSQTPYGHPKKKLNGRVSRLELILPQQPEQKNTRAKISHLLSYLIMNLFHSMLVSRINRAIQLPENDQSILVFWYSAKRLYEGGWSVRGKLEI